MSDNSTLHGTSHSSGLSRRSFINVAIGSIAMVPAALSAAPASSELGPTIALAEEENKDTTTTLTVAKSDQLNIVIFDVTGGGKKRIPNAAVSVFCPNTKKNYELNTGSSGVTIFDIAELADPDGLSKNPKVYKFYGTITIKADGYRTFRSGIMQFKGGTSVQAVTRKIEPGVPYPALCTFDQYDILYTENEFISSSENNADHVLRIELENAGTKRVSMTLGTTDGTEFATQYVTPTSGVATFEFKSKYLSPSSVRAFPAGAKFVAKYSQDGKYFQHDLRLKVSSAPKDAQTSTMLSNVGLLPLMFNSLDMNMAITIPKFVPILGGSVIKPPWPDYFVHVGFDPTGYVRVSLRTPEWGYKSSSSMESLKKEEAEGEKYVPEVSSVDGINGASKRTESSWKTHPRKDLSEQWDDMKKAWSNALTNTKNAWNNKGGDKGKGRKINFSKTLSFTLMGQVTGWGEWRTSEQYWRLGIAVQGVMAFKFTYMLNAFAGPVPILLQTGVDLSVVVGYAFAAKTPEILGFSKYEWDFGTDGLTVSIKFIPYFSIGIGIKGLGGFSVKAAATLTIYSSFSAPPGMGSGNVPKVPLPHVTMAASINGFIVVEIWLITYEIPLSKDNKGWGYPKMYDNWRIGNEWNFEGEGRFRWQSEDELQPMADEQLMSLQEFMNSGSIISESSLNGVVETVAPGEGITVQSDGLVAMAEGDYDEFEYVDDNYMDLPDDAWATVYDEDYREATADGSEDDYPYPSMDIQYVLWSEVKDKGISGQSVSGQSASGGSTKNLSSQSSQESMQPEGITGSGKVAASVAMAESSLSLSTGEVSKSGNGSGGTGSEGEMGTEGVTPGQQQSAQPSGNATTTQGSNAEGDMGTQEIEPDAQNATGNDGLQAQSEGEMGSAEPTLTAQANVQRKMIPTANNRRKGNHEYQNIVEGSSIKERGPELGLVPGQDVRLMSGVLSDTRSKVVKVQGDDETFTFLFRLGTVGFGDFARSRIMFSLLDPNFGVDNYNHYIDFTYSKENPGLMWKPGYSDYRPGPNAFAFISKSDTVRTDYYDYDYDVYVERITKNVPNGDTFVRLHLVIISGKDRTSVAKVLANPVVTYLRYDVVITRGGNLVKDMRSVNVQGWPNFARTVQVGDIFNKSQVIKDFAYHSILCPKINIITDTPADDKRKPIDGPESSSLMVTFLDRAARTAEEVLSDDPSRVGVYMGVMFAGLGTSQSLTITKADGLFKDAKIDDSTIREMVVSERLSNTEGNTLKNKHLVMFKGSKKAHYFFLEAHANVLHKGAKKIVRNPKYNEDDPMQSPADEFIVQGSDYYAPEIVSIKRYEVGEDVVLPKLIEWPGHEEYLFSSEGRLQKAWWENVDTDNPILHAADVGPEGFEITGFGVDPTGNFIYYPSSREGIPGYDTTSEAKVDESGKYTEAEYKESDPIADYRVMACKLHGESFSEPFVFAELDHPADLLELASVMPACMAFVSTNIVDGVAGKGDIWYTAMPNVRSLTVLSCEALGEYVFPGEKAVLRVSVRNDGNTYLSGFTARMRDLTAGKTGSEEVRVTFGKDTLMQSSFNPLVEGSTTGELQNVEPDYALAPGKSAVYQVEFTVPNDWKGTRKVTVLASDATVAASDKGIVSASEDVLTAMSDELYAQAEEVYPYDADWADDVAPYENLDVIELEDEVFYDAPIQVPTDGGGVANADGSQPNGQQAGAAAGNATRTTTETARQTLPRTADASSLGPIATAAGAAGAAMIAYSRRRARVEKELRNRGIDLDD